MTRVSLVASPTLLACHGKHVGLCRLIERPAGHVLSGIRIAAAYQILQPAYATRTPCLACQPCRSAFSGLYRQPEDTTLGCATGHTCARGGTLSTPLAIWSPPTEPFHLLSNC